MKFHTKQQIYKQQESNYHALCGLEERMDDLINEVMRATGVNVDKVLRGGADPVFDSEAKTRWYKALLARYSVYKEVKAGLVRMDGELEDMLREAE